MTCQELDRLLYPYLDGEFQPEERMDMETHLGTCADCARRVEQEREIQQALRRAARHSVQSAGPRSPCAWASKEGCAASSAGPPTCSGCA
jgi:anti-sigma factor RsiW